MTDDGSHEREIIRKINQGRKQLDSLKIKFQQSNT